METTWKSVVTIWAWTRSTYPLQWTHNSFLAEHLIDMILTLGPRLLLQFQKQLWLPLPFSPKAPLKIRVNFVFLKQH